MVTLKQQRFIQEYLIDLNATTAYQRAGYKCSDEAARRAASRLLTNVDIQAAIQAAIKERAAKLELSADRVLKELATIGLGVIGDVLDFSGETVRLRPANEISENGRRMLASVKVKRYLEGHGDDAREVEVTEFKFWDKVSALEKLGRHLGLFPNRVEHTGIGQGPIEIVAIEVVTAPSRLPIVDADAKPV